MPASRIGGIPESAAAVALLRAVCRFAAYGTPLETKDIPSDSHRTTAVHLAKRHQLTAPLYRALVALDPMLPERFDQNLKRAYFGQAARSLATIEQARDCGDVLHRHAIPFVLLKGVASLLSLYDDPACRSVSDIDILVPAHAMDAAGSALQTIGFTKLSSASSAEHEWLKIRFGDGVTYTRPASLPVEVHARFRGGPPTGDVAGLVANRSMVLRGDAPHLRGLSREMAFLHTATHLFGNTRHGTPFLRDAIDLLLQAQHIARESSWPQVWEASDAGQATDEVAAVVELLNREWSAGIPADQVPHRRLSLLDIVYRVERTGGRGQLVESIGEMAGMMRHLPSTGARLRFAGGLVAPRPEFIRWRYRVPQGKPLGMYYVRHTLRVARRIVSDVLLRLAKGR